MPKKRITIIKDDTIYMELMKDLLDEEGYRATIWDRKEHAYYLIKRERPNLVIDIRLQNPTRGGRCSSRCGSIR